MDPLTPLKAKLEEYKAIKVHGAPPFTGSFPLFLREDPLRELTLQPWSPLSAAHTRGCRRSHRICRVRLHSVL